MANLDRSLDEILADKGGPRNRRTGDASTGRRRDRARQDHPRDGVRKSYARDDHRTIDEDWVHDRFEDHDSRRAPKHRRRSPERTGDAQGTRIRVENIHYELSQEELEQLFAQIGPVSRFNLLYDRAGRSEGVAFVTYEHHSDATRAIKEYHGANANGQPIRLFLTSSEPASRGGRNPFDTAVMPSRPLADRITLPEDRSRSLSPARDLKEEALRKGIDRYVPGSGSRSPNPARRTGRRPGARRDQEPARNGQSAGQRQGRTGRPKKTQEELDAEMADYFGGGQSGPSTATVPNESRQAIDDVDMIE